jgi:hypothetical protein
MRSSLDLSRRWRLLQLPRESMVTERGEHVPVETSLARDRALTSAREVAIGIHHWVLDGVRPLSISLICHAVLHGCSYLYIMLSSFRVTIKMTICTVQKAGIRSRSADNRLRSRLKHAHVPLSSSHPPSITNSAPVVYRFCHGPTNRQHLESSGFERTLTVINPNMHCA